VARHKLDKDRHRSLIVSTEDRVSATAEDTLLEHHLDLPLVGDGVQVGTKHHPSISPSRHPGENVPGTGLGGSRGVILANLKPQRPQLGSHSVGNLALFPGWAANLAKPDEGLVKP